MDEFALIRLLNRPRADAAASGVTVGIGDDAAVLAPSSGRQLVVSCDTMVETVHFKPETMRYADIGYKAMASGVSDMAAMGAEPRWALVALTVPRHYPVEALRELYDGLYECAGKYGTAVVGGDTTSSPSGLTVTVTVIGEAASGMALLRSAAKPGDVVFVTGPLGGSAAGLHYSLARGARAEPAERLPERIRPLVRAHRRPEPRVDAGRLLGALERERRGALNDISDGLASEAWEIAEASGVRIVLDGDRIPMADELREYAASVGADPLDWALYGGEDYELVGTVPVMHADELFTLFERNGLKLWRVGEVLSADAREDADKAGRADKADRADRAAFPAPGVHLIRSGEKPVPIGKKGFNHFA